MKIEVNEITGIKKGSKLSNQIALQLDVVTTERQQEDIIHQIWENIGDDALFKIIELEGYTISKNSSTREIMGDFYGSLPAFNK